MFEFVEPVRKSARRRPTGGQEGRLRRLLCEDFDAAMSRGKPAKYVSMKSEAAKKLYCDHVTGLCSASEVQSRAASQVVVRG